MNENLEILIYEFGELDDRAREAEKERAKRLYMGRLATYPQGPVEATVEIRNIGRGADFKIVAITIASAVASTFIGIPKAHKLIRESCQEWRRIFNELDALFKWLLEGKQALYPDHYLLLLALAHLSHYTDADALMFQNARTLPEDNPDLKENGSLLFSFTHGQVLEQVAVSRKGAILWHHTTELQNGRC